MKQEWFYRIKGFTKGKTDFDREWGYRPILAGFIEAESKDKARKMLESELNTVLPMRIKRKDIGEKYSFLLAIYPSDENNYFTRELKKPRTCPCGSSFILYEKQIALDYQYGGDNDFCGRSCAVKYNLQSRIDWAIENNRAGVPVIYKITNKLNGKCYIGQTHQPFTLRWWQHLNHNETEKFGSAIKESKITDWTFEVIEIVSTASLLNERERYHIEKEQSIVNGYNQR